MERERENSHERTYVGLIFGSFDIMRRRHNSGRATQSGSAGCVRPESFDIRHDSRRFKGSWPSAHENWVMDV